MASVSGVYSKALFNVATEKQMVEKVATDLREFDESCSGSEDARKALYGGLFDGQLRKDIVTSLGSTMKLQDLSIEFLKLLAEKNRLSELGSIRLAFEDLINDQRGVLKGTVSVASLMDDKELSDLVKAVSKQIGKQLELEQEEDDSLVGGFVVTAGGMTFDSSLKTQLHRLKEACASV